MKDFIKTFSYTLMYNVVTISAVVFAVVMYAVRSFNENNGKDKIKNFILTILKFVDAMITQITANLDDGVPVDKVAHKSPETL